MKKQERQAAILSLLQEKGEVHTAMICRTFDIVEMTVRRDFMEMEARGEIIRTHGGAIAIEKKTSDAQTPLMKRLKTNTESKHRIAICAKSFVQPNDAIFIASGSTIDIFAQTLFHSMPLTIVTGAINVAFHLYQDSRLQIYMLGGELRSNALTLTGTIAESNLQRFRLKKAFISVNAIDEKGNLYTSSVVESPLLKELFKRVETVYVLADATKLGKKDLVAIEHPKRYTLITDRTADVTLIQQYQTYGIDVKTI